MTILLSVLVLVAFTISTFHILSYPLLKKWKVVYKNMDKVSYLDTDYTGKSSFLLKSGNLKIAVIRMDLKRDFYLIDKIDCDDIICAPIGYVFWEAKIRKALSEKLPETIREVKYENKNFTHYL